MSDAYVIPVVSVLESSVMHGACAVYCCELQAPDDSDGQEATESTSASKWALTFFWKYLEQTLGKPKSDQVNECVGPVYNIQRDRSCPSNAQFFLPVAPGSRRAREGGWHGFLNGPKRPVDLLCAATR